MGEVRHVKSLAALRKALGADAKRIAQKASTATQVTARRGARVVANRIPKAFGSLKGSVHVVGRKILVDAPHAAPVETGSRPHWPPFAPILAWVKLRGMQGLGKSRSRHAKTIARQIREMGSGRSTPVDVPAQIARAICAAIAKHGTKPHWYARSSLPEIRGILDTELKRRIKGKG